MKPLDDCVDDDVICSTLSKFRDLNLSAHYTFSKVNTSQVNSERE